MWVNGNSPQQFVEVKRRDHYGQWS
ncbi:MAG: hypothetical protein ACD_54C00077G0003, partial [uncultured bacterium]